VPHVWQMRNVLRGWDARGWGGVDALVGMGPVRQSKRVLIGIGYPRGGIASPGMGVIPLGKIVRMVWLAYGLGLG